MLHLMIGHWDEIHKSKHNLTRALFLKAAQKKSLKYLGSRHRDSTLSITAQPSKCIWEITSSLSLSQNENSSLPSRSYHKYYPVSDTSWKRSNKKIRHWYSLHSKQCGCKYFSKRSRLPLPDFVSHEMHLKSIIRRCTAKMWLKVLLIHCI